VTVEAAEAGGRQRLVDRGEHVHPRVARRDTLSVTGQQIGELRIDQTGIARAAAMMDKTCNRPDAEFAQASKTLVRPGPVADVRMLGRDGLPHDRVAHRPDPESRDGIEVGQALKMSCLLHLIAELVSDLHNSALNAAPQLERLA
jgi:hypothetical protein